MLAMGLALNALDKQVSMIGADPVPRDYRHLPGAQLIRLVQEVPEGLWDGAVILECNDTERTGIQGLQSLFTINIDHHASSREYANLNWVDVSFASVGQLVLRLLDAMGVPLSADIATNIYAALMTDTGNFVFPSTTPVEFMDAARLVQTGAKPAEIAEQIYHSFTFSRIRLLASVLSTMESDDSGRIAWVHMTHDMMESAGARQEETEGIINHLMQIESVRLAAFFKQDAEDRYKLSLRSKGDLDVSRIAVRYQGGGHKNAAGFTLHTDLAGAKSEILQALRALLNHQPH
jgi:phosphoesterase RecJ-like protein